MPQRILLHVGGVYAELHEQLFGARQRARPIQVEGLTPALVDEARRAWQERLKRTFEALQTRIRFLSEVVGCGDPLEVYGAVVDLVQHQIRQVSLCQAGCESFGTPPVLPDLVASDEPSAVAEAPMLERAVATAICSLAIDDTLRMGNVRDLAERCRTSPLCEGLAEAIDGQDKRERFAWTYVREGIRRFPPNHLAHWRALVESTLTQYRRQAAEVLETIPEARRTLAAWPEPERANVGIQSRERQALLFEKLMGEELEPKLREVELL